MCSRYGGIRQRWLVIESEARQESDLKRLEQKRQFAGVKAYKQLQQLQRQSFACASDALAAAERLEGQLRFHHLIQLEVVPSPYYHHSGRPKKGATPDGYYYCLSAQLTLDDEVVSRLRRSAGRFVLATNVLDSQELSDEQMLSEYKAQQATERGFRFLKDPLFFTCSVFLKSPQRVAALAMVMGLCLLIYTLAQRALRQALTQAQESIPNQLGKPTATPTMRWVFQCFQSIHWVCLNGVEQIANLREEHQRILRFLGSPCQQSYLLV